MLKLCTLTGVFAGLAVAAAAQSTDASNLSAEEIRERLLGQTRGLQIAPLAPTAEETQEDTATASAGDDTAPAAAPATTTTVASVAPVADPDSGVIVVPEDQQVQIQISFDFDSAALRPDQAPKLDTLCTVLKTTDIQLLRIVGHTDASGSAAYNDALSLKRAEEIKRHMVDDCGIAASRLQTQGAGERNLLNADDPNGEINRRVEFQGLS